MNNCGVYLIVSPTGGRYVGSSNTIAKRWNRYKNYSCSRQCAILSSLKKHGVENHTFKILFNCEQKDLLFWERVFGDLYLSLADFPQGLNITLPGYGDVPQVRSLEFRERVSKIQKQRFSDPEERRKTSEATKGGYTDAVKATMSKVHKKRFEDEGLRKQRSEVRKDYYRRNPQAKIEVSNTAKRILAERPELRQLATDTFAKFYAEHPEARSKNAKKVVNTITGETYKNAQIVADTLGVTKKVMQNRLSGAAVNHTPYKYAV